ncbi:hypothetical protein CHUAL_007866 [Chamberlinius hualienensis]
MNTIINMMISLLLITMTIWEANSHHILDECEDFRTGVSNTTQEPLQGTLYTQAYRNLDNNTNNGLECCRFIGSQSSTPNVIDVQCTWINVSDNNQVCRENITLVRLGPGLYNDQNTDQPQLLEIVIKETAYGLFLYSCSPKTETNLIRLVTSQQNPTIPWNDVAQQFEALGFPGYQNVTQSPSVCTNY